MEKMLDNLDLLRSQQHRVEGAWKAHKGALKTGCERTQKNPQTFLRDAAMRLNNLGVLHGPRRMEKAGKECKEALKIDRNLTQKNLQTYRLQLANTLSNLGKRYFENSRLD